MRKKRHSAGEIAAKLQQADEMAVQGKLQGEIAKALGISVMTYHRWRKGRPKVRPFGPAAVNEGPSAYAEPDQAVRISELQAENVRLRRLVTDLLLEKIKLEEVLDVRNTPPGRRAQG